MSLPAVVRPTVAHGSPVPWAAPADITALPVSCVWSGSSLDSAPSIDPERPTATDATCILTGQGWLYLVAVLDVCTRRVVGWAMHQILDARLVTAALRMALCQRHPSKALIVHSDRGAQFASAAYRQVLSHHGLIASMSRKGNCYDNAFIESFWSSLKYEVVYPQRFATFAQARSALFNYIETFYNRIRLHSSLAYCSPVNFESQLKPNNI
jgi:putative transposase